jgi:hypothetical protein
VLHIVFIITLLQLQLQTTTTTDVIIIMCGYEDPNCLVTCKSGYIIIITTEILLLALIQIVFCLITANHYNYHSKSINYG